MSGNENDIEYSLLDIAQWRIMRKINLRKDIDGRSYSAMVVYYRSFVEWKIRKNSNGLDITNDSDYALDEYDEFILSIIQERYPDAAFHSHLIYIDIDANRIMQKLSDFEKDIVEIRVLPHIDLEYSIKAGVTSFTGYLLKLNLYSTSSEMPLYCNEGYEKFFPLEEEQQMRQFMEELCQVCLQS